MGSLGTDMLIDGCGDESEAAGLRLVVELEPIGGDGAPIKPPIYAGSGNEPSGYQPVQRWVGSGDARRPAAGVVIDSVPSQANRAESELARVVEEEGLPEFSLLLDGLQPLPPHLPSRLSSYRFPHRAADAYLRDSLIDGTPFPKSEIGAALLAATPDDPDPLAQWFPHALALGLWQSHLGRKGSQAKLARSWVSEIVGLDPVGHGLDDGFATPRHGGIKGDALNLSTEEPITRDPDDGTVWSIGKSKEGSATKPDKLSNIGHGQVPFSGADGSPAPISFGAITQTSTLSLPGLRRVWAGPPDRNAAIRALAAATVLLGHVHAHARPFSLRSGCDLRPRSVTWTWLGPDGDEELDPLPIDAARELFQDVVAHAANTGLLVGPDHWSRLDLTPNEPLAKAIRSTYPAAE